MADTTFNSRLGAFELLRRPHTPQLPLQAWDAADEYLLTLAADKLASNSSVLAINDQFGALALLANKISVTSWSDSYTAHLAATENLRRNHIETKNLVIIPSTETPQQKFSLVLWRIPKNIHLLQQQTTLLRDCIDNETTIFAAAMQKHLPAQTSDILATLGKVEYLLAQKKARALRVTPNLSLPRSANENSKRLRLEEYDLILEAGPNVFARDKFDIGTRFFLAQLDQLPEARHIADLGCGNGAVGLQVKRLQPAAKIEFFDESYQAVAAAKENYRANAVATHAFDAEFHVDDIFSHYVGPPFDLILCNPPFHQGHVVGDHIAWQMFMQSKRHLRNGGELWIVGNRHLDYHLKLKKIFGNCRQVAANPKFVVLAARHLARC